MAANTRISYSVGLNVDTKQAKQDMNELLKTVTDISKQAVVSYDTKAVKEGIAAARELEKHLTKAFNVQTGNLDLSKFNASLRQSGSSLETLSNKLMSFGPSGQAAFNQLANSISSAQLPLKQTNQMVDNLLINLKKTAQWQISSSIIHGVVGQINSAIGYVRNLNKSLTDIAIVSDLSSAQLSKFAVDAHKLGKALSTSTLDVTNAALIYFQQGDNVLQSMEKAAITIKAANASANSSAAEMSEYLTAIWNSYKVGSEDLEQYVDMMAALGAKTATSMEEIATAMQKVAATANTVGVGFDQMSSIISTVSSVTRESAESIGTSYKTILARIGDLKLGNLVEDGATVTLGQVSSQLKAIGINVLDAKGDMRDMGAVIEEIGFKWQGMNDAQKAAVAQTIAGKRQYTQLMALFENWDMYQDNMTIAGDSEGALDEMQNKWAQGWEAASNRVRNSLEGIYSSIIDDKAVTGILNIFAEMISGIDSVIDGMGGLGSVVALVGGIFATKLGGRTTEVIDSLRTNLGLMTGQARKDMVALNQQLSVISAKQALNPDATQAQKTHWESVSKATKARSSMLQHQNELSLEQREAFDRESQKFNEAAARKEQAEAEAGNMQRSIKNKSNSRKNAFMDSSLIDAGEVSAESVAIRESASAAQAAADEAQNKMIEAQNAVDSARAKRDALQAELGALTADADRYYDREQQYRDAARAKNEGSSQQGKLEYKAEEEAKKAEALQEQIDAKTVELQKLEKQVQEAENHEKNAAKDAIRKSEAAKSAKAKAKDVAGGENTKILKDAKKEMEKNLKDVVNIPPAKLELDKLIQLQESGATEEELAKQGEKLYEALEQGLLDSVQNSALAEKFNQSINSELENIEADLSAIDSGAEGIDPATMLAQQKQAVADLMADMQGAGVQIPVEIDLTSITTLEQLKAKMTELQGAMGQMGTDAAASADAIEDLMDAFGAGDEAAAIRADADALAQLRQEAGDAEADMNHASDAMEGLAIPTTTSLDAITSLIGGLSTLIGMGATIKGVFDTFQDADATPIEKITAALTLAGTALAAYNALQTMNTTLKNAYITAQAKELALTQGITIEKAKEQVAERLLTSAKEKGILATMKDTVAQIANNVAKAIGLALSGPWGWAILAAGLAIAAATIAIISNTNAQKELNEQTAAVTSGIEEQSNAANKLKGDLQSLASILHNTSLSYEEQLSKINEVTAAYGVQATMLDILSGNYERLESQMRSAALGEAMLTAEDATATRELAEQTAQTRVNNRTVTTTSDGYGNTYTYREDYFQDANTKDTDSSWFHSSTANASLIQDSAWAAYDDATWQVNDLWGGTVERDDNLTGIIREDLLSSGEHYNAEGQAWIGLEEQLNALGFTFDKRTAQLQELEAGMGDAAGLYELLTTTTAFDGLALGADSYTNTIIDQLKSDDMDKVVAARQNEEQMNLIPELLKNENFDFLNTDDTVATVEETMDLLNQTMGDNASLENLQFLTDYMTGFGEYSESAQQISAMADLAKSAIAANPEFELAEGQTEDELAMDILKDLQGELGDEFTVDMLLKINPTDIRLDETTGKYTIDDQAKELAQAIVNTETAKEKQATLAGAEKAATADVISKEDYATLQASGLFETDEELRAFAAKGAAERAALWEQMNADAVAAEIEGLQQQKDAATAALAEVDEEIQTALENLADTVAENSLNDGENGIWDQFAGLEGEALFSAINDERARVQAEMTRKQAAIDEYNSWDESTSDEDKAAWRKKYGVTEGQESSWISQAEDDIIGLTSEVEAYNDAMAEAEGAYNKKAYNQSILDSAEDAIDQAEYWEEVGSKIEKASKGAETYANAIGKLGDMDADDLAWMQVQDENALNNYRTMTDDEWNQYAYEQSMQYYNDLMSMYDEDSVEYVMALEAKEQATQDYYDGLAEKAQTAAEIQQQEWEDAMSAADQAMSSSEGFMSGDMSFANIEALKQNLIDAGVEVERVAELIDGLQNAGGDTEQIKAAMVAASEAALAKLGTLNEQKQEYTGLVTNLDTSPIEPIDLPVGATTGEVDDTTLDETREEFESDPMTPSFGEPEGEETVSTEVASWGDGKTVTFTDANGDQVEATIAGYGADQTITYTDATTGQTVTKKISELGDKQTVTFTTAEGDQVEATIASFGDGQVITYADATTGETVTAVISGFGAGQTLTYIDANGTEATGKIASFGAGQTITYTDATTGETVTATIAGWGAGQTLTFVDATTGETVTATIETFGDSQQLVYTKADGTTVKTTIEGFGLGQTLSFATAVGGENLQASIDAIGVGQTIVFTNPETGETFEDTIEGWTFTNEGLTLKCASGAETTVAADVLKWTGLANNNLVVAPKSTTQGDIQGVLSALDFNIEATVNLNTKAALQAVSQLATKLTEGLSEQQLANVTQYLSMTPQQIAAQLTKTSTAGGFLGIGTHQEIQWNDEEQATMGYLVQGILEMDQSEIDQMVKDGTLGPILEALQRAMNSEHAETANIARALYQGLCGGLSQGNLSKAEWVAALKASGMSDSVIEAFCIALDIHSPSRLTMALAPYLFDGLALGIAQADANFNINDLEGVRRVIAEKFQTALQSALEDGQISVEEMTALGMDEKLAEHYNGILSMDGETQSEKFENYKASIGQKAVDDHIRAAGQQAYDDAVAHNDRVSKGMLVAGEAAEYINPKEAMIAAQEQARANSEELERIRQEAINAFITEFTGLTESTVANFDADFIKERKWLDKDSGMTDVQKSIMESAVQQALKQGGWSDIDTALREGEDQFIALVQQNLNESGRDIELEIESTWAELQDIWTEGLMKIYDEETELAEKTYELWKSTFDAIAKARLGLMDGKSILETMFGDEEGLSSIIETYLNQGKSMQEIVELLKNPEASVAFDPWDAENYHKSGPQRFLERDANNNYTDTTVDQYNANVSTYVNDTLKTHLGEVIEDSITQDEIDAIAKSKDPAQLAFLEYLASQGLVTKDDKGNYLRNETLDETTLALDEVLAEVIRRLSLDTQEEVNAVLGDAAATQQGQLYQRADTLHQEGQQYIQQQQESADLVQKAREALLNDQDLSTTLSEAEQQELLKLTGATDLTSISLKTLDSATIELANTMMTMSQQLGIAMAMVQSGQADSWTIDPETGQITTSKTYDTDADLSQYETDGVLNEGVSIIENDDGTKTVTQALGGATVIDGQYSLNGSTGSVAAVDDSITNATSALETMEAQMNESYASSLGMSTEEFDSYMQALNETIPLQDQFNTSTATGRAELRNYAHTMEIADQGWKELTESQEENFETLKTAPKGSSAYAKSLTSLTKTMKKVFNGSSKITEKFVEDHLDDIEKMAEGDEEALERVQDAFIEMTLGDKYNIDLEVDIDADGATDSLGKVIDNYNDMFADAQEGAVITPEVDNTGATQALLDLINAGGETANAVSAALSGIGWTPEIEYVEANLDEYSDGNGNVQVPVISYDEYGLPYISGWTTEPITSEMASSGKVLVPKIGSGAVKAGEGVGQKVNVGGLRKTGAGKTGTSTPSKKSGGGGGGSKNKEKKDKINYEDEIERYHEIQEELKRTEEALSQIDKLKERAWGKNYLKLMDQETQKLRENIAEQQRYRDEIAGYLAQDRQAAAALGAQFDAEGNISNYDEVMRSIIDEYNAAIEAYNNSEQEEGDKLALEDAEERFEEAKEALEQYEETLELNAEAYEELLDLQNQLSEAELEKITYKIEIVTELNDADLEILQYYQDTYEDNLDKQDDLMRNLTQQAQEYESNILVLNDAMAELQAKFAAGEINEADFAEGMQELRDQALGYAGDLEDLKDQFVEVYENALSLASEEVQNFTEKMQDSADMMDTYISLTQLMGRGTNYRELEKFYETQYKANLANLETQRAYVDSLEEQAAYFEEQMKKNGELTATEQEQYEALQDALREANSELASTTEAALSSLQAAYQNSINAIFKELDASIAGTAGSLADLADQYAYYQEEQSRYVSTAKELYEVSKLNRSIEQSLEDATTDASKAKLKALQEEINYISEKNDLTEYDIEMMNLQYQLTLAQIALEEAQASKDTVRLTRDQDGNMAYQYTANQEKVSQAQQQYEDVLQQINDLAANRVSELEQQCLDAEQQYLQSAQEILLDTTLTDEQRTKKLEELSQRYSETLLFIQGQYNNASQALTQNQQAVAEHYGQALVNSMGEASLQMNTVIGDMIGNAQSHIDAFNQAIEEGSMGAWSDYMDGVAALTNASGLTYDNLIANADDYAEVAENANQAAQDLIDTFTDSFEDINAATEQWDAHLATLEGVQQMYENIATSAQNTLEVLSGFTAGEGVGDTQAAIAALLGLSTPESVQAQVEPIVEEVLQDWIGDENNLVIEEYQEQIKRMKELYEQASDGFVGADGGSRQLIELTDHEWMEIKEVFATELSSFYAAQQGWGIAAGTVQGGGGSSRLDQTVHITADFPNATDQNEIRLAFEELINLASQHVYSSAAVQKNR